jgi:hypothetical protein
MQQPIPPSLIKQVTCRNVLMTVAYKQELSRREFKKVLSLDKVQFSRLLEGFVDHSWEKYVQLTAKLIFKHWNNKRHGNQNK